MPVMTITPRWIANPNAPPIPIEVIVADAQLTNYLAVAAISILVADYLSTVNQEINFVWRKPWSFPNVLYLWNRYIPLITVIACMTFMFSEIKSDNVCRSFIVAEGLVSTVLIGSFDFMLTLRVWILYGKSRRMAWMLFPLLVVEMGFMLVILLLPATYLSDFVHAGPILPGCYFTTPAMRGPYFSFFAVPPLVVTFIMFILTVYQCSKTLLTAKGISMPFMTLFLRDGVMWFLVVFAVAGAQMIIWAKGRATLTQVLILPSLTLYSMVSSRVLLNIKALATTNDSNEKLAAKICFCDEKQSLESQILLPVHVVLPRSPNWRQIV
ncbi:hypothetical protein C8J57DRAFT_1277203 [Mycena rebaudengoi]|nr:hypothetical protein C8J57DRAFT_1277203 [Mycena rebaudengoi]